MSFDKLLPIACLTASVLLTSGCGGFTSLATSAPSPAGVAIKGKTFGGQQPVSGATIQLYQVGATGYGAGATALLNTAVTTDSVGSFTITGDYTCTPGMQVYITATGGDPGSGTNNALALMAGLGLCNNLTSNTNIFINEITTIATVYALAPFMNGSTVGSSASNAAGLVAAFEDINLLANTATGVTPGPGLPLFAAVPTAEINTLADILASCINSTGAGDGGPCDMLFTSAQSSAGVTPADTITAMLNVAQHPGRNVSTLMALITPTSPFEPTLVSATDFTIGIVFKGSGLIAPSSVAIDAGNNVWITNSTGNSVTELSHTGATLSGIGFGIGSLDGPSGVAIDSSGDAWVINAGNSTLAELTSAGFVAAGSPFSGGGLSTPSSVAIDALGYIWTTNKGNSTLSAFSPGGAALSPTSGFTGSGVLAPLAVAVNPR